MKTKVTIIIGLILVILPSIAFSFKVNHPKQVIINLIQLVYLIFGKEYPTSRPTT